jgi:outer membrane protein W
MNASRILAVAALAAVASFGAQADEADASQYVVQFHGTRSRAEVQAEAVKATGDRSIELAANGTQTLAAASTTDRAAVRAETVLALRQHQIPSGERSL